jgi:CheY-like chemotaxis protein
MKHKLNTILLIDDDHATNVYNRTIIAQADVADHIHICDSGPKALAFLKSSDHSQPAIIFLDVNMPGMDGWEFLENYHRLHPDQQAKVIVIMLTTSLDPNDEVKAKSMGTSGFIRKPLTVDMVRELVERNFL